MGVLVTLPATAMAGQYMGLPWTNNIYRLSSSESGADTVSVFDDGGNKCYVLNPGYGSAGRSQAISCVKEAE